MAISLSLCFVTTLLEKPNFYRDFELLLGLGGIIQQLPVKSSNECESEEKQSGVNRSRSSLSLCFVTLGVDKSNFLLEDLELIDDSIFVFQKNI